MSRPRTRVRAAREDWLLTYADAITLLLCLFMALFAASAVQHRPASCRTPVPPPASLPSFPTLTSFPIGRDLAATDDSDTLATRPVRPAAASGAVLLRAVPLRAMPVRVVPPRVVPLNPVPSPALVSAVATQPGARIEQHGRLTTIEVRSEAFFANGEATLSEDGRRILALVANDLRSTAFDHDAVTVEGHTDDSPISTARFPSNWELSAARAAAVARFLVSQGVPPQRLRAAGYADSQPVASNRDAAGRPIAANQAMNRRVVIKLERPG